MTHAIVLDFWGLPQFFDWGVYLGGATADKVGCTSTPGFVSFVRTTGFGFMPLWDDLQAPLNCTSNSQHMSANTTTARTQGQNSGRNAIAAMAHFGFSTFDNVWLDIEPYAYTTASCKAAVNAYVDGWDSVVAASVPNAGVYGSAQTALSSWASLAHVPSAVWIARYDKELNTVWGITDVVSNGPWIHDQRIHQYRGSKTYKFPAGCSGSSCTLATVDVDCADAWIDGGLDTADDGALDSSEPTTSSPCLGTAQ